jgi:hypothetical protein
MTSPAPTRNRTRTWRRVALRWDVVRRALASSLLVGPVLVVINHGGALLRGDFGPHRIFQIALTMCVPYVVSTMSSIQAILDRERTPGLTAVEEAG